MHVYIFEYFNLSHNCNQVVTTTLPSSEGLYDCSHGLQCLVYILFAHAYIYVDTRSSQLAEGCSQLTGVASHVNTCTEGQHVPMATESPGMYGICLERRCSYPRLACPYLKDVPFA
ncbi:TPA: hypothetical protein ACH3X2_009261 [Trebouxia sp. C0005]